MPVKKPTGKTLNVILTIKQDDLVRGMGIKNSALIKQVKQKQRIINELEQDIDEGYTRRIKLENEKKELADKVIGLEEWLNVKMKSIKTFRLSVIEKKESIIDELLEEIGKFDKEKADELSKKYKNFVKVHSRNGVELIEIKDSFRIKEQNNGRTTP